MEGFPINELLMSLDISKKIYNRGIGGFTTENMLESMEEMVFGLEPARIFINIGTNDIAAEGYTLERLLDNYRKILTQIRERLPQMKIYVMAYYLVNEVDKILNEEQKKRMFATRNNANIQIANDAIEKMAQELNCDFINVNKGLTDEGGILKPEYTGEGIHLKINAYLVVLENLKPYLQELTIENN